MKKLTREQALKTIAKYEERATEAMNKADKFFRESDVQRCYDSCKAWDMKAEKMRAEYGI